VLLSIVKQRLAYVDELLTTSLRRGVEIEGCALQIRLSLEHVVLSTLVANRPGAAAVSSAFAGKDANAARKLVRRINRRYWPIAFDFEQQDSPPMWVMAEPSEPYLREQEWSRAYGYCSSLLHAPNPYSYLTETASGHAGLSQRRDQIAQLAEYSRKIQRLIKFHQVHLSEADHSFICRVYEDHHAEPRVEVYHRTTPNAADAEG
jgi:hypothetical protein